MKSIEISWTFLHDISWGCFILSNWSICWSLVMLTNVTCWDLTWLLLSNSRVSLYFAGIYGLVKCSSRWIPVMSSATNATCFEIDICWLFHSTDTTNVESADLYRSEMLRRCLSPNLAISKVKPRLKTNKHGVVGEFFQDGLKSLNLLVNLNKHSILRNIDDGKVELFWWKKQ